MTVFGPDTPPAQLPSAQSCSLFSSSQSGGPGAYMSKIPSIPPATPCATTPRPEPGPYFAASGGADDNEGKLVSLEMSMEVQAEQESESSLHKAAAATGDLPAGNNSNDIADDNPHTKSPSSRRRLSGRVSEWELPSVNVRRERIKCAVGTILTLTFWVTIFLIWYLKASVYEYDECPTKKELEAAGIKTPGSCEPCGSALVLPLFGEYEQSISKELRAVLYFVGLLWVFLGIGIVCDLFMGAIEEITSTERVVWLTVAQGTRHKFHVKIWNGTVANLTLMALGSSAPEILLNVVEICGNNFYAGELGPSTIVGSAAFNLFVISAVCISALPAGEQRKIQNTAVFGVTASVSIFAYFWLIVILTWHTPDKVDVLEAVVTFAFFPLLVAVAFSADRGHFLKFLPSHKATAESEESDEIIKKYGKGASKQALDQILQRKKTVEVPKTLSKAAIRKALMSGFTGGKKAAGNDADASADFLFGFTKHEYVVSEGAGNFDVKVVANRPANVPVSVSYITKPGTAKEGYRYEKTEGELHFPPFQVEQIITIPIIDNDVFEPEDEIFYIQLFDLIAATPATMKSLKTQGSELGAMPSNSHAHKVIGGKKLRLNKDRATVAIQNDDMPGTISFDTDEVFVEEDRATLHIRRDFGTTSKISFWAYTEDGTALDGKDYVGFEQQVTMEDGQAHTKIQVEIKPGTEVSDETFRVILDNPSTGVKFDKDRDGGEERAICEVIIAGSKENRTLLNRCIESVYNHDIFMRNMETWITQFAAVFWCNGSPVEQVDASATDWFFHALSFPFKLLFAFVPPAGFAGGWSAFCVALVMIGAVTVVVGDMAGLLGCCIDLSDDITAITLVALGTSLPDTFASKVAAQQNPTADDSIGNVTGSNSVNVFLGLGLPWSIGAFYWKFKGRSEEWDGHLYKGSRYDYLFGGEYRDGGFMVPAGSLSFSVQVFTACALATVSLLILRRVLYGAELGGASFSCRRDSVILVLLWFIYVTFSILKSIEKI